MCNVWTEKNLTKGFYFHVKQACVICWSRNVVWHCASANTIETWLMRQKILHFDLQAEVEAESVWFREALKMLRLHSVWSRQPNESFKIVINNCCQFIARSKIDGNCLNTTLKIQKSPWPSATTVCQHEQICCVMVTQHAIVLRCCTVSQDPWGVWVDSHFFGPLSPVGWLRGKQRNQAFMLALYLPFYFSNFHFYCICNSLYAGLDCGSFAHLYKNINLMNELIII